MSLAIPSVTIYEQILTSIQALQTAYAQGSLSNIDDIISNLRSILTQLQNKAGGPLLVYEPVGLTEPPSSVKMNKFWQLLQWDAMIAQYQTDILQAAAIITNNMITTQILTAQDENAQLKNQISVLQLYTNSVNANTLLFGDYFQNSNLIDNSLIDISQQANVLPGGGISLGLSGPALHLEDQAIVLIKDSSNGFVGNNQEIDATTISQDTTGNLAFNFISQNYDSSQLSSLTDNNPTTWFEYEHVLVSQSDQELAENLNFTYHSSNPDGTSTYTNWANVPQDYSLQLDIQFNLGSAQQINTIEYDPFGMEDNSNFPVLIQSVQISPDGTTWTTLSPQNVWIGTASNVQTARDSANVVIGSGYWDAGGNNIQYVTFHIVQPHPVGCQIGHLYYVDSSTGNRTEGPEPEITDPALFNDPQYWQSGSLTQNREIFSKGQRWGIGIRDISIAQNQYQPQSIMISKPFNANAVITDVALNAQISIPANYPVGNWVQLFVSPDDGTTWAPIATIQNPIQDIPAVISFNNPLPTAFKDPTVGYYSISGEVNSIRVKAIISQPDDGNIYSSSPIVHNYQLKVLT